MGGTHRERSESCVVTFEPPGCPLVTTHESDAAGVLPVRATRSYLAMNPYR
jgi:hypothetical protein